MARKIKPWRRKTVGYAWYAQINGQKVYLGPPEITEKKAQENLDRVLAGGERPKGATGPAPYAPPAGSPLTCRDLINLFLEDKKASVEAGTIEKTTFDGYLRYLGFAAQAFGRVGAERVKPRHVLAWIAKNGNWKPTTRKNAAVAVRAAFNWGYNAGHVKSEPLKDFTVKADATTGPRILTNAEMLAVVEGASDQEFRDLIAGVALTGCLPREVYGLKAGDVDLRKKAWTVRRMNSNRVKVVPLNGLAVLLTSRLARGAEPDGLLFRNSRGDPWTRFSVANRMKRITEKLGLSPGACLTAIRETFKGNPLDNGVRASTVAAVAGVNDVELVYKAYPEKGKRKEGEGSALRFKSK